MQIPSQRLKNNNFDLLRLVFAAMVCLVHAYQLSGFDQLAGIASLLSSSLAVKAFFVVSGFLIFMSYDRSSGLLSYAKKRARRIYPAYFVVIMTCAIGLVLVSTAPLGSYFGIDWGRYLAANLTFLNFLHPALPGVFAENQLPIVNGALWTLKIEVMFYLAVPVLAFGFRRLGRFPVLAAVYFASVCFSVAFVSLSERTGSLFYAEVARQLPGQLSYFMGGAFFYYYLPLFERKTAYFVIHAVVVLIVSRFYPLPFFEPFAIATVVIFFGLFLYAGNFGKYGDFSYGAYIVHFPVIQILLGLAWFHDKPWAFLAAVIGITAVAAIGMWHLVEKRFLHRSEPGSLASPIRMAVVA